LLCALSQDIVKSKIDLVLFSPAIFDPSLCAKTGRGLGNVIATNGIYLDNDGGGMSHQQFAALFPTLRFIIYNSFNSTEKNPRYRVHIPTTGFMTKEAYEAITREIIRRVWQAGYEQHGFDLSKLHAASLFYRPSKAKGGSGFFHDYAGADREALDPEKWLESIEVEEETIDEPQVKSPACPRTERQQVRIDRATQQWRADATTTTRHHKTFFRFGCRLAHAGCSEQEIKDYLHAEAAFACDPNKRRTKIEDVIRSLVQYRLLN
jgi:hypothetical protein